MSRQATHILIVDDNAEDRADLRRMLLQSAKRRYRFSEAARGDEGLRQVRELPAGRIDCILLDYRLPDMDASEVLAALCDSADLPPWPVVVITGADIEEGPALLRCGAQDYIGKRWTNAEGLERAVANAIERYVLLTERKRAEAALHAATAAAVKANRAKSDFLSGMSHELRSPLNAILGFAQLLESGTPAPSSAQKESVEQILRAGWYLLDLINEILDLALIESGKSALTVQAVSLAQLLSDCQEMTAPQAECRGVQVSFPRPEPPWFVSADPTRAKQVLLNLLGNAIKYNRSGGQVEVCCSRMPGARVRISVQDSGPGLAPAQLAQLFQPFNRLGQEAGGVHGTGIGLVMSKQLVELMGGRIGLQSKPGVGSLFWFELDEASAPAATVAAEATRSAAAAAAALAPPAASEERLRSVLCVEDNAANMTLVEKLIARRPQLHLLRARDAQRGLEIAREAQPDVILMDIHLPGMNGMQAMARLAADAATARIPVIALSAHAMPQDIEAGLAAGFLRYLTKPIRVDEFMRTLDLALNLSKPATARMAAEETR